MITVVNKRAHVPTDIDFPVHRGTPLGNPYDWKGSQLATFKCCCRADAIEKYKKWLVRQFTEENEEVLDELRKIYKMARKGDVNLVCYCVPENSCHATFIKQIIEFFLDKKNREPQ